MSDEDALLAAIIANPDEDTPRLAYADWLEENSQPERAEFIRLQIRLATLPHDDHNKKLRQMLEERADRIRNQHNPEWLGRLGWVVTDVRYQRGLVNDVWIPPDRLLACRHQLFRSFPLRTVYVTRHVPHTEATDLRIDQLQSVAAWPELNRLTLLALSGHAIGDAGTRIIAECPHFRNLTHLFLNRCAIADEGVKALSRSPHLGNLIFLDLGRNHMGAGAMIELARSQRLPNLQRLDLVCALHEVEDDYAEAVQFLTDRFGDGFGHTPWD